MSVGWAGGSTRAWRRLRAAVLERDRYRCQVPTGEVDGQLVICGRPARTVGHVDALALGGRLLADASRLRAECEPHNYGDGARLANARRRRRSWSW